MPDMRKKIEEYIADVLDPEIGGIDYKLGDSFKEFRKSDFPYDWYEARLITLEEVKQDLIHLLEELVD